MLPETFAGLGVNGGFVRRQRGQAIDVLEQQRADDVAVNVGDMEAADVPAALDQRKHDFLTRHVLVDAVFGEPADIGFVGLDDLVRRAAEGAAGLVHGGADAMAHEPGRLVGDAEHAVDLMGADPLLGRGEKVGRQKPLEQRHLGALEYGPYGYGVLLATIAALDNALADGGGVALGRLTLDGREALRVERAAVRAEGAIGPADALKMLAGRVLVRELGGVNAHVSLR